NLLDIPACADLFCALGHQVAGEAPPLHKPRYHFDYPGSTHGFTHRNNGKGRIISITNYELQITNYDVDDRRSVVGGQRSVSGLQVSVRKLGKKGEVRLYVKTAYRPAELSANYYGASFSAKIAPGQQMRARLYLPPDAPEQLLAALYVWDDNSGQSYQNVGHPLQPGQWHELSYQIPVLHNACLTEAGLVFRNLGQPWTGSIVLDYLDWDGTPRYSSDFSKERPEYGAISQWTTLRGYWRLEGGAYHGSGPGVNESYSGDIEWRDHTLTVRLVPLLGDYHNINLRVQGALRSYAVGLAPGQKLTLYKNAGGYQAVASADFPWRHHRPYTLSLTAEENHLTVKVDGETKLEWCDQEIPYLHGQIGLSNFAACHTRYESVEIEPVHKER
ncbi:MAG TPA: hypothetical protein G4N96_08235, partial [Chloroflexi bacterium]|nr:hypothetical protein [Chloroflexota bacterium]